MTAFDRILEEVAALRARVTAERTTLRLGTVQSSGTVLLTDGAEVTPAARLTATSTGDVVLVGQHNRRAYVLGKPPSSAPAPTPTWTLLTGFANGWGNYNSATRPPAAYRVENGRVHLRGFVAGGSGAAKIVDLPSGLGPPLKESFVQLAGTALARVDVEVGDSVTLHSYQGGSNDGVSFAGMSWDLA